MAQTNYEMVKEFHEAFGLGVGTGVSPMRETLIKEERAEALKELCDFLYVCLGRDVEGGILTSDSVISEFVYLTERTLTLSRGTFQEAFKRVHESNMSKLDNDGKPVYREDGKVFKSDNYKPTDLSDLV